MTFKKFIIWFGIVGSVASIVSLAYIFIPSYELLQVKVNTLSLENLTENSRLDPELKITYKYKGEEVSNLWKYTIRITNVSNKTIIGISSQKNILTDVLSLDVQQGYDLLDKKLLKSDFTHKISLDSSKISLSFQQWRPNESVEYAFYIKVKKNSPVKTPFFTKDFRQIIDGDFIFTNDDPEESKRITQVVPNQGLKVAYIINFIVWGLFVLILIVLVIGAPLSYFKASIWYRKYYKDFAIFIRETKKNDEKLIKTYLDNPKTLPNAL